MSENDRGPIMTSRPVSSIHVVPTIDQEAGGPSYSVTRICQTLQQQGCPIQLAVLEPLPENWNNNFAQAFPYSFGPKKLGRSLPMKYWLRNAALSGSYNIIHNHSLWMMPNIYSGRATLNSTCQLVVSPEGTFSKEALKYSKFSKNIFWHLLQGPAIKNAAAFHATSIQEYYDIRKMGFNQPVAILPNGIDIPTWQPSVKRNPYSRGRHLLYLGRIHPIKGLEDLLKAWSILEPRFTDWQLTIVGPDNSNYSRKLQKYAGELGLKYCNFTGALYGEDKLNAYRHADLYVLPTRSENFGMTVAEALAAGSAVITTKGAPWQGLEKENAGWWVDIGLDPLVAALEDALNQSPMELSNKGMRGREWMKRDYSWHKISEDMASFYLWLAGGDGQPPNFVKF